MSNTQEVWRDVVGYPGYQASSWGRVRHGQTILQPAGNTKANVYLHVGVSRNGQKRSMHVHTLVLLAFSGEPEPGQQCRHLDGNKFNNRPENLRWGTWRENMEDAVRLGAYRGEKNGNAALTADKVQAIKGFLACGMVQSKIADLFGVTQSCIAAINNGRTWKHLATEVQDANSVS